jgi:DNA-directed RNA polymerases I and III subunit RPAC1
MFSNYQSHAPLQKNSFEIHNVDVSIVNALRRIILSEIPVVAVAFDPYDPHMNDITFIKNTTSLHNEYLGHRISLIPIYLTAKEIATFDSDRYEFIIEKHNTSNVNQYVTTDDIDVIIDNEKSEKEARRLFPRDPTVPNKEDREPIIITLLKPNYYNNENGEHLHVRFQARVGIAKTNAAWCPVSLCSYTFVVDEKKATHALKDLKEKSKEQDKITLNQIEKQFKTLDIHRHYKTNDHDEPNAFKFSIESECQLTPVSLFSQGIDILIAKVEKLLENDQSSRFDIHAINREIGFYAVSIYDEDHTLGNLLQSLMYNMYHRDAQSIEYVGYNMPHPLETQINLKIKFTDPEQHALTFFENALRDIIAHIKTIRNEWVSFAKSATQQQADDEKQDLQDFPEKPTKKTSKKKDVNEDINITKIPKIKKK